MTATDPIRAMLAQSLAWGEARVSFDDAVKDLDPSHRGVRPAGLPHSAWELLEHIRLAQSDILEFCLSASYREKSWPADYWPPSPEPPDEAAWDRSIESYRADRVALQELAADPAIDLGAKIAHGSGQTYLRELLLVVDHSSYHVGQLVVVRQLLGAWR